VVDLKQWKRFVPGFWTCLRSIAPGVDVQPKWERYHLGLKKGPGRRVSLLESLDGLYSLPQSLISSIKEVGGFDLSERIDWLLANRSSVEDCFGPFREISPRRVQAIQDSEGKSRVIAMLDYFSQTCLLPVHQYLFKILACIPQDVTFHQGAFVEKTLG
jgi:hypothetical protein